MMPQQRATKTEPSQLANKTSVIYQPSEFPHWHKAFYPNKTKAHYSHSESFMKSRGSKSKKRKNAAPSNRATIAAVIRLEQRVWKAAKDRNAIKFKELVPSDAIMIFQSGIISQPEYLATMNQRTIARYELRRIDGFMPNATTVILYYQALRLGEEGGKAFPTG